MPYHSPLTCLTITLPCLTNPNAYPLSFLTCFTSPYTYALQYFYPLPYHSLLLHLTISFPLPYHALLPCLTISHSTTLHNCTNKLPWQFCHLMPSEVIGHHQRSPHFLQLLCEPWTPYFLLYFGSWKSNITKLTSTFHGCHGQRFLKCPDYSITFSWQNVKFPWPTEQTIHPIHHIFMLSARCVQCAWMDTSLT